VAGFLPILANTNEPRTVCGLPRPFTAIYLATAKHSVPANGVGPHTSALTASAARALLREVGPVESFLPVTGRTRPKSLAAIPGIARIAPQRIVSTVIGGHAANLAMAVIPGAGL
jgi:hypothetical protein